MKIIESGTLDRPLITNPQQVCRMMRSDSEVLEFGTPIPSKITHWAELERDDGTTIIIIGDETILESMSCSVRAPHAEPGPN